MNRWMDSAFIFVLMFLLTHIAVSPMPSHSSLRLKCHITYNKTMTQTPQWETTMFSKFWWYLASMFSQGTLEKHTLLNCFLLY